jgi:hypothetical protein
MVAGCSGTTHSSAEVTLFKIPFGHAGKASKNEQVKPNENANCFPKKLDEMSLFKVLLNEEATNVINKMHGQKLDECENFIAHYGSNNSKNILYVSVYENAEKAETNIKKMAMKMASGSSVYSPLTHSKMGDNVYFETKGMGLKHYFYRVDNILIWWQVELDKAKATYNDLLKFDFTILNDRVNKQ